MDHRAICRLAEVALDERDHDLWALWKKCRAILLAVPTSDDDEPLKAVEQSRERLPRFRSVCSQPAVFERDEDGVTVPLPDKPIDLQNTQRVMEAVRNFFKGADGMLDRHAFGCAGLLLTFGLPRSSRGKDAARPPGFRFRSIRAMLSENVSVQSPKAPVELIV